MPEKGRGLAFQSEFEIKSIFSTSISFLQIL